MHKNNKRQFLGDFSDATCRSWISTSTQGSRHLSENESLNEQCVLRKEASLDIIAIHKSLKTIQVKPEIED